MPPHRVSRLVISCLTVLGISLAVGTTRASEPPADSEYSQKLEIRVDKIVSSLALADGAKQGRVHEVFVGQYRELNAWHASHDAELKTLRRAAASPGDAVAKKKIQAIEQSLQVLHAAFLQKLGTDLTAAQVETVKDTMTYNKVKVTYDAYCQIVPNLTESDKTRILELLKEARELAMDGGSAEEKSAVFGQYKGKINNYLSTTGHDVKKAYRDWGTRHSAKPSTEPAAKK